MMRWMSNAKQQEQPSQEVPAAMMPPVEQQFSIWAGRTYRTDIPYILPVDEQEAHRLDFQHHLFRHLLRGNYVVPIQEPRQILDVGSGTGRWSIEMAQEFPRARIVAIDLTAPQEAVQRVPENYTFMQQNIFDGLPFNGECFDYVHQRMLHCVIPMQLWQGVMYELARVTAPGGWIELIEGGMVYNCGHALEALQNWLLATTRAYGVDLRVTGELDVVMREAGLQQVKLQRVDVPLGSHGGRIGTMMEKNLLSFYEAIRGMVIAQGIAPEQYYGSALAHARREIAEAQGKCFCTFYVACGQKV